jgi:hypothetical protein
MCKGKFYSMKGFLFCFVIKNSIPNIKKTGLAGCQWLMPVILATQEAEIRRIAV